MVNNPLIRPAISIEHRYLGSTVTPTQDAIARHESGSIVHF